MYAFINHCYFKFANKVISYIINENLLSESALDLTILSYVKYNRVILCYYYTNITWKHMLCLMLIYKYRHVVLTTK